MADYDLTAWFAAFVPAGTPAPVVDRLNAAFTSALADGAVAETLLGAGIEPASSTPEELTDFAHGDREVGPNSSEAAASSPNETPGREGAQP